jgi:N-acetylneuraminic acid mutarotase
MKGCLYVLGGLNTGGIETAVERFDPSTDSWSTLAPMPAIKGSMDIVEHAGRIIVFGGADLKCKRQPEVIKYDPLLNSWTRMPNIARGRADLESAALVGPPENLLSVFSERISMRETNLVIQRYQDKRHDTSSSWRVPAYKGRLRAVMALDRE